MTHLEFLYRVLAEAVRVAARARAFRRLAEEHVVTIRAIHQNAVGGSSLPTEGEIAAARRIAHYPWSEHGEIQEVAPADGKIANSLRSHGRAGLRTRALQYGGVGGYYYRFSSAADRQWNVDGSHRADG
jgi:hypothetical protein